MNQGTPSEAPIAWTSQHDFDQNKSGKVGWFWPVQENESDIPLFAKPPERAGEARNEPREPVEKCKSCKFYTVRSDDRMKGWSGYCRRFPPSFKEDRALNDGWPYVHGQSWCGEYKTSEG